MDQVWVQIITVYGPLGLGWPVALYLLKVILKDQRERDQNLLASRERNTQAILKMEVAVARMVEWIKELNRSSGA